MTLTPAALPALELTGTVMAVSSRNLGTSLAEDVLAGATSLTVIDNATVVQGNQLRLTDPDTAATEIVVVAGITGADVLTLTGGTANDYAAASTVTRVPAASEVVAFVSIIDQAEPLPIVVEHSLADALPRGTREPGQGEVVHVTRNGDGELRVVDVLDRKTSRYGVTADNVETGQGIDGETPGAVRNYVVATGTGDDTLAGLLLESGTTPANPNGGSVRITSGTDGDGGSWLQTDSEIVSIVARAPSEPNYDALINLSALHGILLTTRSGQPVVIEAPFKVDAVLPSGQPFLRLGDTGTPVKADGTFKTGVETIDITALNTVISKTVTFASAYPDSAQIPVMQLTFEGGSPHHVSLSVSAVDRTSFIIRAYRNAGATGDITVHWTAIARPV